MKEGTELKKAIHAICLDLVEKQERALQESLNALRDAGAQETKSSAGDKYETTRAMIHFEQEKLMKQLAELSRSRAVLQNIRHFQPNDQIVVGSLVYTDQQTFYISAGLGKTELHGETIYLISAQSPIGKALMDPSNRPAFSFNSRSYKILKVI